MINSSPVSSWEGAEAIYTFAGGAGDDLFFWIMVLLCIVPLFVTMKTENITSITRSKLYSDLM